ncbi:MAG: nitroreductase family protein, partial [Pseudomonadota bacterium]
MSSAGRPAPTELPIHPVIRGRWSGRAMDAAKPVERETVLTLLEAARWAPSCFGDEPWRYIVWDRNEDPEGWEAAASILAPKNQEWARSAPILLAVLANSQFSRNGKPNRWGEYDTGAATENLHLQGVELGLVVHQMGGFDGAAVSEQFGVPEHFTPMAMVAIGYPGPIEDLGEDFQSGETGERERRPL